MKELSLSVVIPTYNRRRILRQCLDALLGQAGFKGDYEVIVVDDGSSDGTEEEVYEAMSLDKPAALRYFKQEHRGPASARNIGIRNASGSSILFLGDDMIASPWLLSEHCLWHRRYPEANTAVLGYITWSPRIKVSAFMRWLENGGPQFHYWQIDAKTEVDSRKYFYSSNVSLKREFLLEKGIFDEEFQYGACEDMELGHRLSRGGLILKYNKNAVVYHNHPSDIKSYRVRQYQAGISSVVYNRKVKGSVSDSLNEIKKLDSLYFRAKWLFYLFFHGLFSITMLQGAMHRYYDIVLERARLLGVKKGLEEETKKRL